MVKTIWYRLLVAVGGLLCSIAVVSQGKTNYHVLFVSIDDLKPAIGAYGDALAKTPAMDQLAKEGSVFLNNHCQQAVCSPSRASLLSGLRPDRTRVWDLTTKPRVANPSMISLPQHFRSNGYETIAFGKIFHLPSSGVGQDSLSWSISFQPSPLPEYYSAKERVSTEAADVPDTAYQDGAITQSAIQYLKDYKQTGKQQPFFLAVGYKKPHLPFVAPKKYWDHFSRNSFSVAPVTTPAKGAPRFGYTNSGELRNYTDIPDSGALPANKQLELLHGYYAAVSYVDAQLQQLIIELKTLGLYEKTVIVLWGDHGWHLGDHGQWTKHTNYEQATRSPLIIRAPVGKNNTRCASATEFVDVFPTLCELAGVPVPNRLDGVSLVPLMRQSQTAVKKYAVSQYPRGAQNRYMGYALRDERYRLVVWVDGHFTTAKPFDASAIAAVELYDYEFDPQETSNLASYPRYAAVRTKLEAELTQFFQDQYKKINGIHE